MPTFPFEVVLTEIFKFESDDPNIPTLEFFNINAGVAWAFLVLLTPIYFFLHIWLEAIIPDAYGVTESCCFCFRSSRVHRHDEEDLLDDEIFHNDSIKSNASIQDRNSRPLADEENGLRNDEEELKEKLI